MTGPWLKFFPSDWRADPALRSCSIAARGLWMEMLCIMHEAEPRGSLLINGRAVSDKQLANLAGIGLAEVDELLAELHDSGVFSTEVDGTIYSRRMRKDEVKAAKDKAAGSLGGNPTLKPGVNPPANGGDKAQKPEARDQISSLRSDGARRAPKAERRHRLPETWEPTDEGLAFAYDRGFGDVREELAKFKDHHRGRGNLMVDWNAAWRTWIGNAERFGHGRRNVPSQPSGPAAVARRIAAEAREQERSADMGATIVQLPAFSRG